MMKGASRRLSGNLKPGQATIFSKLNSAARTQTRLKGAEGFILTNLRN